MKITPSFFLLVLPFFLLAQNQGIVGNYEFYSGSKDGDFELRRSMTLNDDGSFEFHAYRRIEAGIPPETHKWGKGKWSAEKNLIRFSTDEATDIAEKYSLNFSRTKARYKTKSPRDISNREIKTALIFYESDIFWIKGMTLVKK